MPAAKLYIRMIACCRWLASRKDGEAVRPKNERMSCVDLISFSWGSTMMIHKCIDVESRTYDHRLVKTGHPVRSAIHKH